MELQAANSLGVGLAGLPLTLVLREAMLLPARYDNSLPARVNMLQSHCLGCCRRRPAWNPAIAWWKSQAGAVCQITCPDSQAFWVGTESGVQRGAIDRRLLFPTTSITNAEQASREAHERRATH